MPACRRGCCANASGTTMAAEVADVARAVTVPLAKGMRTERSEFLWHSDGPAHIHGHVARPVVMQLDRVDARSVLDLGCGNGWLTAALSRCGFDVVGLDSSHSGIQIARQAHSELTWRQADALLPPAEDLRGHFDAVVAVETVDHVAQPRLLLQHALQMLRPGGWLLVTVPYHGYLKNLGVALSGRFDLRLHALQDHGRLKFFSRRTLMALVAEAGFVEVKFQALGRLPAIARSMLISARKPLE